jgi:insulysin
LLCLAVEVFALGDRFAQFFTSPLFTPSATEREVSAVHSENDRNLQNDSWRLFQLEKSQSKAGHDFAKFGTGKRWLKIDVRVWINL